MSVQIGHPRTLRREKAFGGTSRERAGTFGGAKEGGRDAKMKVGTSLRQREDWLGKGGREKKSSEKLPQGSVSRGKKKSGSLT